MKLSAKSEQFLQKIVKYYPLHQSESDKPKAKVAAQHMHDYRKERQIYQKPTGQKLQNMRFFKEEGNNHYKNSRFKDAAYFYEKTIIYGDYTFPQQQLDQNTMDELLAHSHCNLALCMVKMGEWGKAKTHLMQSSKSKIQKIRAKGLYWLAKYYVQSSQLQLATEMTKQVKGLGQKYNKQVSELEQSIKWALGKANGESKKLCENIFNK